MKRLSGIIMALLFIAFFAEANAQDSLEVKNQNRHKNQVKTATQNKTQVQSKFNFVDENGDGYNDNAPDHDGDGIPNAIDEDYTGPKARGGHGVGGYVDEDGDGFNDNAPDADGDGIPNGQDEDYTPPADGTGMQNQYGKMQGKIQNGEGLGDGSGECDGTGPKGNVKQTGKNN